MQSGRPVKTFQAPLYNTRESIHYRFNPSFRTVPTQKLKLILSPGTLVKAILLIGILLAGFNSAYGQSSIFAAPSTDTQPRNTGSVSADAAVHIDRFSRGGFQTFGPSTAYGVAQNVEIGANLFYTWDGSEHSVELQPHAKWRYFNNDEIGIAAAVGVLAFIPLTEAAGSDPTALIYANASKRFKPANGLRLTGGLYTIVGSQDDAGTRAGALVGIEQPVTQKLTLVADWISGKNKVGYSSAGFRYSVTKSQSIEAGYSFGNSGRGNNFLAAFYTFNF